MEKNKKNKEVNKINNQIFKPFNLELPIKGHIFSDNLQKILDEYDEMFINHIISHYYDGQISKDTLESIQKELKSNKESLFN